MAEIKVFADQSLKLAPGDVMLLYTDGVTEALKKTSMQTDGKAKPEMFGDKRLIETFRRLGGKSPEEIKNGIIEALNDYKATDDISLLICKHIFKSPPPPGSAHEKTIITTSSESRTPLMPS